MVTVDRPVRELVMEISDDLLCLFTARIERSEDAVVLEVPDAELRDGDLSAGDTYRVALFGETRGSSGDREPPVDTGEVRSVEIEGIGDQGDGIARVDHGYVLIVPGTDVGDEVDVEIQGLRPNFAMAEVVQEAK